MAGPHQNMPNKSSSVPLKPLSTAKPGPLAKKRALETLANVSTSKRAWPAGGDGGEGPSSFLNPFTSHHHNPAAAEPFDPGMSVAESEELTRRMQQQMDQGSSEAMSEMEQATDDSDADIDPSLQDMDSISALTEWLSHKHTPIQDSDPVQHAAYMHPKGYGSISASRVPVSATSRCVSTMQGPTPNAVTASQAHSVTPSTTCYELG
ncbi:uncharacterized protein BJ212DRAFT_1577788 [Suillus subaureus]|uniref:Uncharacterized protein n=1 Tax=Suillus subaureus TaxID=48587 RepID=A0A9P7E8Q3_9AGAM|nr:uncharacterized protein BJ212DRAFT_1577788 [Suillus subaureus]KAG1814637.1 hypothetical protein BJ212DRAFT_1577788 [Suillus subaureus]